MVGASIFPLKVKNVTIQKRGNTILDDVSFQLEEKKLSIVMGPNGAGKTMLLRSIQGLENLNLGAIEWNISEKDVRDRIAFVFQTPIVLRRTVLENIIYPLVIAGESKAEAIDKAKQWIDQIGLAGKENQNALLLSGGERQKLAIARALISNPDVLILDEPTANLDGKSTKEIETIVKSAQSSGTKIIMTTHSTGQAKRLADEVLFINKGRLIEQTNAKSFFKASKTSLAGAYLRGDIIE